MHPCLRGCLGRQSALTNPVTAQRPSSGRGLSTLQAKRELEAELRRLSDALEESTVRRETLEAQVREQVNETELLRKVRLARARAAWVGRRREQASCQGRMRGTVAAASVRDHWLTLPSTRAVTHLGRRGVCVWGGGRRGMCSGWRASTRSVCKSWTMRSAPPNARLLVWRPARREGSGAKAREAACGRRRRRGAQAVAGQRLTHAWRCDCGGTNARMRPWPAAELSAKLDDGDKERATLLRSKEALNAAIADLTSRLEEHGRNVLQGAADRKRLQSEVKDLQAKLEQERFAKGELERSLSKAAASTEALKERLVSADAARLASERAHGVTKGDLEHLEAQLGQETRERTRLETENRELATEADQLREKIDAQLEVRECVWWWWWEGGGAGAWYPWLRFRTSDAHLAHARARTLW